MIEKQYIELVKRLRNRRICIQLLGSLEDFPLLKEAADAIEELAAFKAQLTDGRFYVYKLGTLFELKRDPRELIVRHQAPPKEG